MAEDAWEFKPKNTLPLYGNKESMNLNSMILTNVQSSAYFKEDLVEFKTFHEVIDEIFYKVRCVTALSKLVHFVCVCVWACISFSML